MIDKENILEMICAAISDCESANMKQTVDTLQAVLNDLEILFKN